MFLVSSFQIFFRIKRLKGLHQNQHKQIQSHEDDYTKNWCLKRLGYSSFCNVAKKIKTNSTKKNTSTPHTHIEHITKYLTTNLLHCSIKMNKNRYGSKAGKTPGSYFSSKQTHSQRVYEKIMFFQLIKVTSK